SGGIVTGEEFPWLLRWGVNPQPPFQKEPRGQIGWWVFFLFVGRVGGGRSGLRGVRAEGETRKGAITSVGPLGGSRRLVPPGGAKTVPTTMPYVTAFFMPRQAGDRPDVVPAGSVNFAFIGQFAESKERDCIFTTEYSVRVSMEAVYALLNVDRGVPEVFNSTYD